MLNYTVIAKKDQLTCSLICSWLCHCFEPNFADTMVSWICCGAAMLGHDIGHAQYSFLQMTFLFSRYIKMIQPYLVDTWSLQNTMHITNMSNTTTTRSFYNKNKKANLRWGRSYPKITLLFMMKENLGGRMLQPSRRHHKTVCPPVSLWIHQVWSRRVYAWITSTWGETYFIV